jgi:hypothetical protein
MRLLIALLSTPVLNNKKLIKEKMKTRLFYLLLSVFFLSGSFVFGQSTSIKSTAGDGPVLSGLKIDRVNLVNGQGNLESLGIGSMVAKKSQIVTTTRVSVDVRYSGKITQYKFNGKTYNAELKNKDCKAYCWDCGNKRIKMTAKIEVNGKVLTASDEAIEPFPASAVFKFDKAIPFKNVKILSATIEPIRYPGFETELQQYEACLKKEKEKEKKEPEKEETTKTDDDFWDGGKDETKTRKIVLTASNDDFWNGGKESEKETATATASDKEVSEEDFWSGENEKPDADNQSQNSFRVINNYSYYNKNNDDKYSWVEDADGNIIIPKGKYSISSFKDGLAEIEKLIRTDYYDFVKDKKVQLIEKCFMDENGNELPPKSYRLSYSRIQTQGILWSSSMSKAEIESTKAKWRAKNEATAQQLKSIYNSQGFNID